MSSLTGNRGASAPAALVAVVSSGLAIASLASLHVLSPEFSPAWRMISEYGNGSYGWVLSLMFAFWGLGALALAFSIRSQVVGKAGLVGLVMLVVAGVGDLAGGVFDINHEPGHSIAGALGIVGLPIAAVLISVSLGRNDQWASAKKPLLWTAHLTWVSLLLLGMTFVLMVVTFVQVDGSLPTQVPRSVPSGVVALVGWANRLLVLAYCAWVITVAWLAAGRSRAGQSLGLSNNPLPGLRDVLPPSQS